MARTHPEEEERHEDAIHRDVDQDVDEVDRVHALDHHAATTPQAGAGRPEDRFEVGSAARKLEGDDGRVILRQVAARHDRRLRCREQRHYQDQQAGGEADAEGSSGVHGRYYAVSWCLTAARCWWLRPTVSARYCSNPPSASM